eukprot:8119371-Alexandrium_andersonii.AAC.1
MDEAFDFDQQDDGADSAIPKATRKSAKGDAGTAAASDAGAQNKSRPAFGSPAGGKISQAPQRGIRVHPEAGHEGGDRGDARHRKASCIQRDIRRRAA